MPEATFECRSHVITGNKKRNITSKCNKHIISIPGSRSLIQYCLEHLGVVSSFIKKLLTVLVLVLILKYDSLRFCKKNFNLLKFLPTNKTCSILIRIFFEVMDE